MRSTGAIRSLLIASLAIFGAPVGQEVREPTSLADVFHAASAEGTFVVGKLNGDVIGIHNIERSLVRFSPASTFKIPNTLIALDAGVVSSQKSQFQWDGTKRGISAWNKDQTLRSAFQVSCLWCYQKLARKVGLYQYQIALQEMDYGNNHVGDTVDQFWVNGDLRISALEQIEFLRRLVNETTQYRAEHVEILKSIMRVEDPANDYTLYAKTGWTGSELAVGWYVGYVEKGDNTFLFAMNMHMDSAEQAPLRKSLAIQALQVLGIL